MKNKKKEMKKVNEFLKTSGIILGSIVFIMLVLYFITSYNSTIVYSYSLNNDKFVLTEGIVIQSRMENVLTFGNLKMKNSEREDFYVELSIGDRLIVGTGSENLSNGKVIEYYGYEEYFTKDMFNKIKEDFKIKIYVSKNEGESCFDEQNECDIYEYKLNVYEEFRNNKLVYFKGQHI